MGDEYHQQHQHQHHRSSSRLGGAGGEIVEVQGGHIVRSTGRKDRHSKVCTAKGPRDRRVRLSAHTAIQFYDVQDRLGYDRPSKAVDWLIKKAKSAIDELAELPAWKPTTSSPSDANFEQQNTQKQDEDGHKRLHHTQYYPQQPLSINHNDVVDTLAGPSSKRALTMLGDDEQIQRLQQTTTNPNPTGTSSSFLPPALDSDSIADTIKSFFPMGASTEANHTSAMQFPSFTSTTEHLLSRTSSHSQDLRLSLQSFQDPILLHHQHQNPTTHSDPADQQAGFFSGTNPVQLGFDGSGWPDQHHHQQQLPTELARIQRLASWNAGTDNATASGGSGGYMYNSAPGLSMLQPFFGQNQFFTQRGPLQSSNTPSIRAWIDPSTIAMTTTDHQPNQAMLLNYQPPPSISGISFASNLGGFSGFRIPSRIQGDEEEHDGISDKPSSASSDSRH